VEDRAGRAGGRRDAERLAHLGEDLVLAEDERLEPRGDAEEVTHRVGTGEAVAAREDVGLRQPVEAGDELGHGFLDVGGRADAVDLAPVAGRDDHAFGEHAQARDVGESVADRVGREREPFPDREGRAAEVPPDEDERRFVGDDHRNTCPLLTKRFTIVYEKSTSENPKIETKAVFFPLSPRGAEKRATA
jgi:hypothetical protein